MQDECDEWELTAQFLLTILLSAYYTILADIFVVQYLTSVRFFTSYLPDKCPYMLHLTFIDISVNL